MSVPDWKPVVKRLCDLIDTYTTDDSSDKAEIVGELWFALNEAYSVGQDSNSLEALKAAAKKRLQEEP